MRGDAARCAAAAAGRPAADPRDAQIARLQKDKAKLSRSWPGPLRGRCPGKTASALETISGSADTGRVQLVTDEAIACSRRGSVPGRRARPPACRRPPGTGGTGSARPRRRQLGPARWRVQPRALARAEREAILDALHSDRFADLAPDEVGRPAGRGHLPRLGLHLLPGAAGGRESRERRAQATHPATVKPELAADGPNQVYSWDITKLHGPAKWTYYHLYVILDIFSRYVVGWMVATCESAVLAEKLIAATCAKQGIGRGQLSIHADRGSSMTSKPVALLLADLGVPSPTPARTSPTTTRTPKRSSRP